MAQAPKKEATHKILVHSFKLAHCCMGGSLLCDLGLRGSALVWVCSQAAMTLDETSHLCSQLQGGQQKRGAA